MYSSTLMLGSGLKKLPAKKSIQFCWQPEQKNPKGEVFPASLATCIINKSRAPLLQKDPKCEASVRLRQAQEFRHLHSAAAPRREQQPLGETAVLARPPLGREGDRRSRHGFRGTYRSVSTMSSE